MRQTRGWTQAQLAALIGASRNSIINWEAGREEPTPMAKMALMAAEAGLGRHASQRRTISN